MYFKPQSRHILRRNPLLYGNDEGIKQFICKVTGDKMGQIKEQVLQSG
jgi:hypothetical protein